MSGAAGVEARAHEHAQGELGQKGGAENEGRALRRDVEAEAGAAVEEQDAEGRDLQVTRIGGQGPTDRHSFDLRKVYNVPPASYSTRSCPVC